MEDPYYKLSADAITDLRRNLLLFYLRHPIGLRVIKSWFADAEAGKIGPGDLLDHKYPGRYTTFLKRCTEVATLCRNLKFNARKPKLAHILDEIIPQESSRYSLVPKDIMLVSLGAYLQSNPDFLRTKRKAPAPFMRLLSKFSVSYNAIPKPGVVQDIAIRSKVTQSATIIATNTAKFLKTPEGYPVLLDDCQVMKKYPALRKLAHAKNLRWRRQLFDLASEWGYKHITKEINQFLNAKIIGGPGHYLDQLKPFSADVCRYLNGKAEILFAGTYPVSKPTPPAVTAITLVSTRLFSLPAMHPLLAGLTGKDICTKHDLIKALLATKQINQASVYRNMPRFLQGEVYGSRGSPTKLARLVAQIAGCDVAIYAGTKVALTNFIVASPRGNGRKSSAQPPY